MCSCSPENQAYPGLQQKVLASRLIEVILPSLMRPHLEYCIRLWSPQKREGMDLLEVDENDQGAGTPLL